ncbi:hypothetical protein [Corynebacterium pelargi]|uniref:hypothetical protein n=1 Tax=Corynebacterium pelargi TaxID=1471400 RepID=UPI001008C865|nr:hypothetical protein [Corynebacterium pelargi]
MTGPGVASCCVTVTVVVGLGLVDVTVFVTRDGVEVVLPSRPPEHAASNKQSALMQQVRRFMDVLSR